MDVRICDNLTTTLSPPSSIVEALRIPFVFPFLGRPMSLDVLALCCCFPPKPKLICPDHQKNKNKMPSTEVDNTEAKAGMSADKAGVKPTVAFRPQDRALYDSKVTLEEYMYYASKTRAEEDANAAQEPKTTLRDILFPSGGKAHLASTESTGALDQLKDVNLNKAENRTAVSALEWTNASRALRSASAAAAFYLISTSQTKILAHSSKTKPGCSIAHVWVP